MYVTHGARERGRKVENNTNVNKNENKEVKKDANNKKTL
jgi:hypothetical protein